MSDIIDGWYYSLVDTPSPLTQEEKEKNVDMFRAYFEGYMTLESMAGILGNMQRESYLNPGQGELNKDFDINNPTPTTIYQPWNKKDDIPSNLTLKKELIKKRGYKCEKCGLSEWLGEPIILE